MKKKYFGTDGIRGRVGTTKINPEFILKLGWAVGRVLVNGHRRKVIIGKDTRVSGYMLESALEAGLCAAGVDVLLVGPMPTPAIAYLTQTHRASAGIVISASHNPFEDNGIKFFCEQGRKLADEIELAIEQEIEKPLVTVDPAKLGKVARIDDASGRYIEFCKASIPSLTRLNGLKIVVDCANGATYDIAPSVFQELGAEVITIANQPDGFNINEECGATNTKALRQKVLETHADVGIALDGDGDRCMMIDKLGNLIDGDQILYIITKDRLSKGLVKGGVVGTLMSNLGLEIAIKELGLDFYRANVGDRYVLDAMSRRQWTLGGESSGHIVCLDKTTTGDGIVAALQVLNVMVKNQVDLNSLAGGMTVFPQTMINIKSPEGKKLIEHDNVKSAVLQVESELKSEGRVLLRASGTEPLVRVMVEGRDQIIVDDAAKQLARVVEQHVEE